MRRVEDGECFLFFVCGLFAVEETIAMETFEWKVIEWERPQTSGILKLSSRTFNYITKWCSLMCV